MAARGEVEPLETLDGNAYGGEIIAAGLRILMAAVRSDDTRVIERGAGPWLDPVTGAAEGTHRAPSVRGRGVIHMQARPAINADLDFLDGVVEMKRDPRFSRDLAELETFVQNIVRANGATRLECFARVDSPLHHQMLEHGFQVPEFFKAIGPLVEWRKGQTDGLGASDRVQTLNWF